MLPTDIFDIDYDRYEQDIRTKLVWDPVDHFMILHRRENYTQRANAIIDIQRTLKTLEDVKLENERRTSVFRRKMEIRSQGRLGGKPPTINLLNMDDVFKVFQRQRSKGQTSAIQIPAMTYLRDPDLELRMDEFWKQKDIYMSQNSFMKWRKEENWASLGAFYLDFDNPSELGLNENELAMHILQFCDAISLPRPSYIMFTGVGCAAVWLHTYCHRPKERVGALGRWHATEKQLHKLFSRSVIGELLDPAVKDVTRVLRVAGTINSKSGEMVRPLYVTGSAMEPVEYDFNTLCDSIFSTSLQQVFETERQAQRAEEKRQRAAKKLETRERKFMKRLSAIASHGSSSSPKRKGMSLTKSACRRNVGTNTLNRRIVDDLERLRAHWGGTIPVGKRNFWLFVASVCAARLVSADVLPLEVVRLGQLAGIDEAEALRTMGSVIRRAQDAEAGKTIVWNSIEVDPRYKFKMETIILLLGLSEDTVRAAGLELIITQDMKKEKERIRKAHNRNQVTAPRSQSAIMEASTKRHKLILELLPAMSLRQVAARVNCSVSLVQKVKVANLNRTLVGAA